MPKLLDITEKLDDYFEVNDLDVDPGMGRYVPMVYGPVGIQWENYFEKEFNKRFNGLMMKGEEIVNSVFASVFPTEEVLNHFLDHSQAGDLLFLHHPIDMLCGDPQGEYGEGFIPIPKELLDRLKDKKVSIYSCHAPLDYHKKISTSRAMVEAIGGSVEDTFFPYGNGDAGVICSVESISTDQLIEKLKSIFDIPYVDFLGKKKDQIRKISVVGGVATGIPFMQDMEKRGVDAYLTGQIQLHMDNKRSNNHRAELAEYAKETTMSLIGVSHSSSEYLIMKTQMSKWFNDNFDMAVKLIPLSKWWR